MDRVVLFASLVVMLLVSCGGDDAPEPTATASLPTRIPFPTRAPIPTATATAVPTPRPGADSAPQGTKTGDAALDRIIAAALQGDAVAIESSFAFRPVPCTWQTGLGGPPKCEYAPGQPPEGTPVQSLAASGCEGHWAHEGTEAAEFLAGFKPVLFAVVRWHPAPPGVVEPYWPTPSYQVLLEWHTPDGRRFSYMLGIDDGGRIVLLDGGCGQPPEYELDRPPAQGAYTIILRGPAYR